MALSDELSKLAELHAAGRLTDEEYARAKARLLDETPPSSSAPPPHSDAALGRAVNSLRRSRQDRWLGGVCGGIGRATGVETWVWRLLFTVLFIFAGAGLLLYLLLWVFVPED